MCLSPDLPQSIGNLHAMLAMGVVNAFAHGASSVVVSLDPEACTWIVDCTAHIEPFAICAGFDADAPLDQFLALRAAGGIVHRKIHNSVILREPWRCKRWHRTPRWRVMTMYDLDDACREAPTDDACALGDLVEICAHAITLAIGSGGRMIRFELFAKDGKLITGDDGCEDAVIRSDDACEEDFRNTGVEVVYTSHYGRMQPRALA